MLNTVTNIADTIMGKKPVSQGTTQANSAVMKAIVFQGTRSVSLVEIPKPELTHSQDVIVKITSCTICSGTDLHLFNGRIPGMEVGSIIGHEGMGIVEAKGDEVTKFNIGDRVIIAPDIACGQCDMCKRQEFTACRNTNDSRLLEQSMGTITSAIFGMGSMYGNVPGSQAEYVRVPFADVNCFAIPPEVPDEKALFMTDILPTSLHATELAEVKEGSTVCIWGLGPVGLNTIRWCQLKGASRIIAIDAVESRLDMAKRSFGIEVLDRRKLSSTEVVEYLLKLLPGGADSCIDAVGFRDPVSTSHKIESAIGLETDSPEVLEECFKVCRPFGNVSVIGDYVGYANQFPIGMLFGKSLNIRAGQCPHQKYFEFILERIKDGSIDPTFVITERIGLEDVPLAYPRLNERQDNWIKVFIKVA